MKTNLTAPSQILARQLDMFTNKHILIAGEIEDNFFVKMHKHATTVTILSTDYAWCRKNKNIINSIDNVQCFFGAQLLASQLVNHNIEQIIIYWPKAKDEASYLLAMLLDQFGNYQDDPTQIIIVGENRSGVNSIDKLFAPYGTITKYDSARRCSLYYGQYTNVAPKFNINDWFKSYSFNIAGIELIVKSLPGVFSSKKLDIGSKLLLDTLLELQNFDSLSGKILDVGCGAGVLGASIALLNPQISLDMTDINAFALESTKETLRINNLSANVFASDVYSDLNDTYQMIITNPPFHSGLDTSYAASKELINHAPKYLGANSALLLVANSFLNYQPMMKAVFTECNCLHRTNKFSVYYAYNKTKVTN